MRILLISFFGLTKIIITSLGQIIDFDDEAILREEIIV